MGYALMVDQGFPKGLDRGIGKGYFFDHQRPISFRTFLMMKLLTKLFKIYEDEISLFLWSALLLFLIRSSNILFNNYAETAFLKRFGVEYLPVIYVINSISTFFIMGLLTGIMAKIQGSRMLVYMLLFCSATVAGL
ncbi:MAG: hypothetical protein JRG79_17415, partial [Deltaproteobacteria bacterium]|nr:hypothetical protein [Deltaproteobacteria bacterium]